MRYLIITLIILGLAALWFLPEWSNDIELPPNSTLDITIDEIDEEILKSPHIEEYSPKNGFPEKGGAIEGKDIPCSGKWAYCVAWARDKSEFAPPLVEKAKDIPIISSVPSVGSWVVLDIGEYGHVGIVRVVFEDGSFLYEGFNQIYCEVSTHILQPDDPIILGYYYEDNQKF